MPLKHSAIFLQVVIKLTEEEQTLFCDEPQDKAILMPDATMLPCDNLTVCIESICFEIKPKYGGITLCDTVSPLHREMKRSNSRYRLHQFLKLSQGKISKLSPYDPRDFFSGDPEQMNAALVSLLTNPQNNCAVFINGIKITLETGLKRAASILFGARITAANNNLDTIHTISLLLQKILLQENVLLEQILKLQRSCGYDIEGVFRLYRTLVEETTEEMVDVANTDECQERAVSKLLSLPRPEAIAVLHSYCLATMARDCSLMITVGRDGKRDDDQSDQAQATNRCQSSGWTLQSCGRLKLTLQDIEDSYLYKISLVDLDRKPLSKIPMHRALDTEILVAAQRYA